MTGGLVAVRASDGAAFVISKVHLNGITTLDELRHNVLSPLLSIPPECLIVMNEEGAQLRDESIPLLLMYAASPETSASGAASFSNHNIAARSRAIVRNTSPGSRLGKSGTGDLERERERRVYVFDRDHLDADPEVVAEGLAITEDQLLTEPELHPLDPLPSHVALSHHNLEALRALITSISLQRASLQLAMSNLSRVLSGTTTSLNTFIQSSSPNMQSWNSLLDSWEGSMDAIGKVAVVSGLLTKSSGTGGSQLRAGGESKRYLGDYVSRDKMTAVRDGCARLFVELRGRSDELKETLDAVSEGANAVLTEFDDTSRELEDLEACESDANAAHSRIEEIVLHGQELSDDSELRHDCFDELSALDAESRDRIRFLVDRKNAMTRYLIVTMQRISNLQSDIASMPGNLGSLDHDLKTRTDNFKHLARLEGLIPAYIATVVEVVRRRSYAQLLHAHSITVEQSVSHLSTAEKTRRLSYRATYSGKLPWEVRGLTVSSDEAIPKLMLEGGEKLGIEDLPDLSKDALEVLRKTFTDLVEESGALEGKGPLHTAKAMLDDMIAVLDSLESEFKEVALGTVRIATDDSALKELEQQIRTHEDANEDLSRQLQAERSGREEEIAQLNQQNGELSAARDVNYKEMYELKKHVLAEEREAATLRLEKEAWEQERKVWEKERLESKASLAEESSRASKAMEELQASKENTEGLERQLSLIRVTSEALSKQLEEAGSRHTKLESEHTNLQGDFSGLTATIETLVAAAGIAQVERNDLNIAVAEKDRLLRDQRCESELERAVLEQEVADLTKAVEEKNTAITVDLVKRTSVEENAENLKEEVGRLQKASAIASGEVELVTRNLEVAKRELQDLLEEKKKADAETEKSTAIARRALKLAENFREENNKITAALSASIPIKTDSSSDNPAAAKPEDRSSTHESDAGFATPLESLDFDVGDLEELLAEVEKYDSEALTDALKAKVDSLEHKTKKWSKEAKAYRERAHRATASAGEKIAFKNFVKGDLALFLPTRNSVAPVWAAFNISFPHHFLAASGIISEQMKKREWIVARITSLTEKTVDVKDPTTNPFLLAPGTKYFLLEVEHYNSQESSRSRKHSTSRHEPRRSSSSGAILTQAGGSINPLAPSTSIIPPPLVPFPPLPRSLSNTLPPNATDLARSEFQIVEEPALSPRPTSPATLLQPVPKSEEQAETFLTRMPSALALSLARSPPPDPFIAGPFSTSSPQASIDFESAPPTEFEPPVVVGSMVPAFLPSRKSSQAGSATGSMLTSTGGSRYIPPPSRALSSGKGVEFAPSPINNEESLVAFRRSSSGSSSILSSSFNRRSIPGGFPSSSPPSAKTNATQDVSTSARWSSMTEDLAKSTRDDTLVRRGGKTMTIGRSSKGWPIARAGSNGGTLPDGGEARLSESTGRTASWGASEIIKMLKGKEGSK